MMWTTYEIFYIITVVLKVKRLNQLIVPLQTIIIAMFFAIGLVGLVGHSDTASAADRTCNDGPSANGPAGFSLLPSLFSQTSNVCVGDMPASHLYFFQIRVTLPYDADGAALAKNVTVTVTSPYGGGITIPMTSVGAADFASTKAFVIPMQTAAGGCSPDNNHLITVKIGGQGISEVTVPNIDLCSSNRLPGGNDPKTFTYTLTKEVPELNPRSNGNPSQSKQHIIGFLGADYGSAPGNDPNTQYHALEKVGVSNLSLKKSDGTVVFSCTSDCSAKDGLELANGSFKINSSDNPTIGLGTYDLTFAYSARAAGDPLAPDEWSPHTFTFAGILVDKAGQDVNITPGASADNLQYFDKDGKATRIGTPGSDPTKPETKIVCTGGALGWMLCPLIDVFSDVINTSAGFLNNLLFISPIGSNTNLQSIWGTFVGIANLLLVVAFLVVIFSQATSIGLSAYGIKKMLPRIIAAALLINLSYFICTIALDITNIIGGTVGGVVQSFIPDGSTLSDATVLHRSDSWASWIKVAFGAAVAGAIAIAVGAIAFIVPLLLSAAFAVLSIFLVVILRQVAVILLIIIAPLAFAAMVLPNTESLFTKWQKIFVNMLVMYPVIMFILYGSQLVGALILASKSAANADSAWIFDLSSGVTMTAAPAGLLYLYITNQNKLMNMMTGGIGKLAKAARKSTTGWAKEKQGNSRFARARAWNKSLREANRIERQGKMTGIQGRLNKAASLAAGPSLNPRKWRENAGKYQASAVNRAAIEADKIFKEDKGNAAAEYAKNGIGGPLMVEHARSGRVVKQNADGTFSYGRKLTEAEHSAAVEWTMANGKLAERQKVYGSDWAAKGRTPEFSRALDTMNDGYFHVNKDVARFGNKFGGSMTSGSVGGDLGVDNAAFLNMASGKTSAEAIIDNDMAQTLANLSALSDTDLVTRFKGLVPDELSSQGVTPEKYVEMFRANVKQSAETVFSTRELNAKVKPEFAGALKELAKLQAPDAKRLKDAAAHHTEVQASKDKIKQPGGQDEITAKLDPSLTTIQPAPNKLTD